jgi:hypothetical protein
MVKPGFARCFALAVLTQGLSGYDVIRQHAPAEPKDSASRFDGLSLVKFDGMHIEELRALFPSPPLFAEDVEGFGVAAVAALTAGELAAISSRARFSVIEPDFGAALRANGMPKTFRGRRDSGADTVRYRAVSHVMELR